MRWYYRFEFCIEVILCALVVLDNCPLRCSIWIVGLYEGNPLNKIRIFDQSMGRVCDPFRRESDLEVMISQIMYVIFCSHIVHRIRGDLRSGM